MRPKEAKVRTSLLALAFGLVAIPSGSALADTCLGACGTDGADGVITLSPTGNSSYQFVTTNGGVAGAGSLGATGTETNGSEFTYSPFTVNAGAVLTFYFNFITSDGNGFPDYAWSQLNMVGNPVPTATLITAQTQSSGSIIPAQGAGFPPISATLTPASVPIIPGPTNDVWSNLGSSSGQCFLLGTSDQGCGYTGWVKAEYTIATAGTYFLTMGVTNTNDTLFDTGLAFDGAAINGVPLTTPLPAALPMFLAGFGGLGMIARRKRRAAKAAAA